jgi:hypothetical protein
LLGGGEEGRGKREEGRGKREEGRGKREEITAIKNACKGKPYHRQKPFLASFPCPSLKQARSHEAISWPHRLTHLLSPFTDYPQKGCWKITAIFITRWDAKRKQCWELSPNWPQPTTGVYIYAIYM